MTDRQCLSCSACCEGWIKAKINGVPLSPYKPCEFCSGEGCAIYEKRPAVPCASFICGWLMDQSPLPEHMKPNACGAIILFDRKWGGNTVTYALPTGERIPGDTLEWLMAYSREHSRPLIFFENLRPDGEFTGTKQMGYGPQPFIEAVNNSLKADDVFML
jgi:hypothetical protein